MINKEEIRDEILAYVENYEWFMYDHDLDNDDFHKAIYKGMKDLQSHLFKTFDLYIYAKGDEQVESK